MRRGHTLFELCAALLLASMAGAVLLPAVRHLRDVSAVLAAREAVVGVVARARVAALTLGGAEVHLAGPPWLVWIEARGDTLQAVSLEEDLGVTVRLPGGRASATVRYDALGLGNVASQTLRFRRGAVERRLIVSGYGRVRRP